MSDAATVNALVEHLRDHPDVDLHLDAVTAFSLAGVLQLACKHPQFDGPVKAMVVDLVGQLAEGLGGPCADVIEAGWSQ